MKQPYFASSKFDSLVIIWCLMGETEWSGIVLFKWEMWPTLSDEGIVSHSIEAWSLFVLDSLVQHWILKLHLFPYISAKNYTFNNPGLFAKTRLLYHYWSSTTMMSSPRTWDKKPLWFKIGFIWNTRHSSEHLGYQLNGSNITWPCIVHVITLLLC